MASETSLSPTKVVIVQPALPHYRVKLFETLSQHQSLDCVIVTGPSNGSLNSVDTSEKIKRINVSNIRLFSHFTFQTLPTIAYTAPIVILYFDVRVVSHYPLFLWRKLNRLPTLLWGHGLSSRRSSPKWVIAARQILASLADAVIFYSEQGKLDFLALGLPSNKLFVAPNTIDLEEVAIAKQQVAQNTKRNQILFIGRLIPQKHVDHLIKAFKLIADQLPDDIELTIIGDGPERSSLEALAMSQGISTRVHFLGEIYQQVELARSFIRSIVSVSPGYIGLSAIHCLSYGIPMLVAQDEPHSPEVKAIIPGVNGVFYSPTTPEALSQELVRLFNDRPLLEKMSNAAEEAIFTSYSIDRMVSAFTDAVAFVQEKNY